MLSARRAAKADDTAKGAGRGAGQRSLALLRSQPRLLLLLLGVTGAEAFYMGCYFASLTVVSKAFARPSPSPTARGPRAAARVMPTTPPALSQVYVVAIKKGGNLLVNSVGGWVLFGESYEGRVAPVLGVVAGVTLMSI